MFTKWGEVQREQEEFYWSSGLLHLPVGQGVVFFTIFGSHWNCHGRCDFFLC